MSTTPPCAVIFDLDGTIVQTRIASWEIFREVSKQFQLGIDQPEEYFALLQENLFEALRRISPDGETANAVKEEFYRRLAFDYQPQLIPGIAGVIRSLADHCPVSVVSSNSMAVLRRVLTDHDVAFCFSHVFGGDVVENKSEAITRFLHDRTSGYGRQCQGAYAEEKKPLTIDPASTVFVGDTTGDMAEARRAGIRSVGVSWGMHSPDELIDAGAEFVAMWPQELLSHLLGELATEPLSGMCATVGTGPVHQPEGCGCDGSCCRDSGARAGSVAIDRELQDLRRTRRIVALTEAVRRHRPQGVTAAAGHRSPDLAEVALAVRSILP